MHHFNAGEVLVADMTDPYWEPIMKRAAAIVTNRGGRTQGIDSISLNPDPVVDTWIKLGLGPRE